MIRKSGRWFSFLSHLLNRGNNKCVHVRVLCPVSPHLPHFLFLRGGGASGVSLRDRRGDSWGVPGVESVGLGDWGNGHVMSLFSSIKQNGLILSYRYHWRFKSNPFGRMMSGRMFEDGDHELFLMMSIVVAWESDSAAQMTLPFSVSVKVKCWNF